MSQRNFLAELSAIYWSAQAEKENAIERVRQRGKAANASAENVRQHIQRTVEDIEHSMRMKLAASVIQYIHSLPDEPDAGERETA